MLDAIIAATAITHNLALVTLNQAHFEAIHWPSWGAKPGQSICQRQETSCAALAPERS